MANDTTHSRKLPTASPSRRLPVQASATPPEPRFDAEAFVQHTARLAQVMVQEIDCLKKMDIRRFAELQAEKNRLVSQLEGMKEALMQRPALANGLPEDQRQELRQVQTVLQQIMRENLRHLKVAYEVNQGVVQAVKDTLVEQSQTVGIYNRRGKDSRAFGGQTLSMTINEAV